MLPSQQEKPTYVLHKVKTRAIIPKVISLMLLSLVFYLGILLNVALLNLKGSQESQIRLFSLLFVILLLVIGIIASINKATKPYRFYRNRITLGKKQILYSNITEIHEKHSIFDSLFKTHALDLGKLTLKHISNEVNIEAYVKQMHSYASRSF